MSLEKIVEKLTDEQLKNSYDEIIELNKVGVLPEGIVHKVREDFKKEIASFNFSLTTIQMALLMEIAHRKYYGSESK